MSFAVLGGIAGLWDLKGINEARYVQIAREINHSGNWLALTLYGAPYDQKPPFGFWFFAVVLRATGDVISTFALRLPSVLAACLTILLTYDLGRRFWGTRAGLIAGFALLTSPELVSDAQSVKLDVMFTDWICLSLWAWLTRPAGEAPISAWRTLLLWGSLAAAILTKGPLALLVVVPVIAAEAFRARSRQVLRHARPLFGSIIVLSPILGWLFVEALHFGSDFVFAQTIGVPSEHLFGTHERWPWYYLLYFPTAIFPLWGFILIAAVVALWRRRASLTSPIASLTVWIAVPFLALTLARAKHSSYILPILPACALLVGWYLEHLLAQGRCWPRLAQVLSGLAWFGGVALVAAGIAALSQQDYLWQRTFHAAPAVAWLSIASGIALMGTGIWVLLNRHRGWLTLQGATAFMLVFVLMGSAIINPLVSSRKTTQPFGRMVDALIAGAGVAPEVGAIKGAGRARYHVYGHYHVRPIVADNSVFRTPSRLPSLLVGYEEDWQTLARAAEKAGYRQIFAGDVGGDALRLYSSSNLRWHRGELNRQVIYVDDGLSTGGCVANGPCEGDRPTRTSATANAP